MWALSKLRFVSLIFGASLAAGGQAEQLPATMNAHSRAQFDAARKAGKHELDTDKAPQAIPFLEKARALNNTDFDNEYDLTTAYLQAGQLDKARAESARVLSIRNAADVHTLIGNIETAAHSARTAAEEYQIAAHMDPSEDRIFDFGRSLLGFESDGAIRIFSYGVEKYPHSTILRIGLGEAFDIHGDFDKAAKVLCEAMDLDPGNPQPIAFLGKLPVVSAENSKQIDQRFVSFLKIHPDHATANYYLARDLLNPKGGAPSEDDLHKGEKLLRIAIQKDPQLAGAHFELGRLCEKRGQPEEALHEYQTAIAIDPDQEQYHYRLSIVFRQAGQAEKAKEEFQTFERLRTMKDEKYGPKNVSVPQQPGKN